MALSIPLFQGETPSSVMFDDLRTFGGISNQDAARVLLSARVTAGRRAPRDLAESRSRLSREVVHVVPSKVNPGNYADFHSSTLTISSMLVNHIGGAGAHRAIVEHYAGVAAEKMCAVLEAYGMDPNVYRNECDRLVRARLRMEKDRHVLLVMLFCIAGCQIGRASCRERV